MAKASRFYGTGRRKSSVARVYVTPGSGKITVNKKDVDEYFGLETLKVIVRQPFAVTGTEGKFDVMVNVYGGGFTGQAGAIRHGISRALCEAGEDYRPLLKKAGFISQSSVEAFKNPDIRQGGSIISSAKVGPSVAKDITYGAIVSVALALVFIFLYILLRFRNIGFSIGSIVGLVLDTTIVIGFFSLCYGWIGFSLEIDQTFIGAILTVIGYDINDSVVVFDRIREHLRERKGLLAKTDIQALFNKSINETLARTINTSVSTLIVLVSIFVLGGDSIRSFAFAMIIGVVIGTLSSIFIASPMAYIVLGKKIREEDKANAEVAVAE